MERNGMENNMVDKREKKVGQEGGFDESKKKFHKKYSSE